MQQHKQEKEPDSAIDIDTPTQPLPIGHYHDRHPGLYLAHPGPRYVTTLGRPRDPGPRPSMFLRRKTDPAVHSSIRDDPIIEMEDSESSGSASESRGISKESEKVDGNEV